jgi:DNA polymerase
MKGNQFDANQLSLGTPDDASEKDSILQRLKQVARECTSCRHHKTRTNSVFSDGPSSARVMIVAEAPGKDEDLQGLPFVGESGKRVDTNIVELLKMTRQETYLCNVLKCRPVDASGNNDTPGVNSIKTCLPFLHKQIDLVSPEVIICLGAIALQALFGNKHMSITATRGKVLQFRGIPVVPTFHPAYLMRGGQSLATKKREEQAKEDWKLAKSLLDDESRETSNVQGQVDATNGEGSDGGQQIPGSRGVDQAPKDGQEITS